MLTLAPSATAPSQADNPASRPLATRIATARARRPASHETRDTGLASNWSRRPSASSARAAVTCPAAVNATSQAIIRKVNPR